MLKVWKGRGRYFVDCGECGSRGAVAAVESTVAVDPKSAAARAARVAAAQKLRVTHEAAIRSVIQQQRAGKLTRKEAGTRAKDLASEHAVNLQRIAKDMPDLRDGEVETATRCPWCRAAAQSVIEGLPDGAREPAEWLSDHERKVAP